MVNAFSKKIRRAGLIVFRVLTIHLIHLSKLFALQTFFKGTNTARWVGIAMYRGKDLFCQTRAALLIFTTESFH